MQSLVLKNADSITPPWIQIFIKREGPVFAIDGLLQIHCLAASNLSALVLLSSVSKRGWAGMTAGST